MADLVHQQDVALRFADDHDPQGVGFLQQDAGLRKHVTRVRNTPKLPTPSLSSISQRQKCSQRVTCALGATKPQQPPNCSKRLKRRASGLINPNNGARGPRWGRAQPPFCAGRVLSRRTLMQASAIATWVSTATIQNPATLKVTFKRGRGNRCGEGHSGRSARSTLGGGAPARTQYQHGQCPCHPTVPADSACTASPGACRGPCVA